jgi:hypothetical protein
MWNIDASALSHMFKSSKTLIPITAYNALITYTPLTFQDIQTARTVIYKIEEYKTSSKIFDNYRSISLLLPI